MISRSILTILATFSIAMVCQSVAMAQARREPAFADTIVLFGAHWCAPCRAEYRILPLLVVAAAPKRLVLAWIDRPIYPRSDGPAGNVVVLGPADAQALADRIGEEGFGLPFSAVFDSYGRLCSLWRKSLRPEDVNIIEESCRG